MPINKIMHVYSNNRCRIEISARLLDYQWNSPICNDEHYDICLLYMKPAILTLCSTKMCNKTQHISRWNGCDISWQFVVAKVWLIKVWCISQKNCSGNVNSSKLLKSGFSCLISNFGAKKAYLVFSAAIMSWWMKGQTFLCFIFFLNSTIHQLLFCRKKKVCLAKSQSPLWE